MRCRSRRTACHSRYPQSFLEGAATFSAEEIGRIEKQWAEKAQGMLDSIASQASDKGVVAKTVAMSSDLVAESIIATARKHRSDLIVMASHGRRVCSACCSAARLNRS